MRHLNEESGPYTMSFGFDLQPLVRSIQEIGLINPIIVVRSDQEDFHVVAGYRRMKALRSLQVESIPCIDLSDSGLSNLQILLFNLYDNLSIRAFNSVEKGMIMSRLIKYLPRREVINKYLPLLDISNRNDLDLFLEIDRMDFRIRRSLAAGSLSLKTVRRLVSMDKICRERIFMWIDKLSLSFNYQSQFVEYIEDISHIEDKDISEVLDNDYARAILEDSRINNPQKARHLLEALKTRRYPALTSAEKQFHKKVARLRLPGKVHIGYPGSFEAPGYHLEILFKDGKELIETINVLSRLKGLGTLGDPWKDSIE